MTNVTTIQVGDITATIDADVFKGYTAEAFDVQRKQDNLKTDWKILVETIAETTQLPKKEVNKYLKARYKLETKAPKLQGELFEALDAAVGEA